MNNKISCLSLILSLFLIHSCSSDQPIIKGILKPENFKHFIDSFNINDNEVYREYIPNDDSWKFLSGNIPLFDCPDKMLEQTYYFRWWTYRKHIKKTPGGFVITEFMPDVPWAGKYNTISCAAGFHFYEGRWLHDQTYLNDYAKYWFREADNIRVYSFWVADALYNQFMATGDSSMITKFFPDMIANFESWEKERSDSTGLFWQEDGRDGMEMSVGGSGYRATINTYMYGEATAISRIASLKGDKELTDKFLTKSVTIKKMIQTKLWDCSDNFFKVIPLGKNNGLCEWRELHGYTPWYFNIPDDSYSVAWKYLMDSTGFFAPYGPTTLERSCPGFSISYQGHECQWNGPSWPYATSITLTSLANLLNNYDQPFISKTGYFRLLKIYADCHQLKREDGKIVPWIDENINPFTGDWIARTRLKNWENGGWSKEKGGVERGKDYNHSTFCDLIITGLIGLRPQADECLVINPLLPDGTWDYFCLDNVLYHGKIITIMYDKTGERYKNGKGYKVWVDGKLAASLPDIGKIKIRLDLTR